MTAARSNNMTAMVARVTRNKCFPVGLCASSLRFLAIQSIAAAVKGDTEYAGGQHPLAYVRTQLMEHVGKPVVPYRVDVVNPQDVRAYDDERDRADEEERDAEDPLAPFPVHDESTPPSASL